MKKKFTATLFALLMTLLIPNLAFAEGTQLGSSEYFLMPTGSGYISNTYKDLDGGTFTVKMGDVDSNNTYQVRLYEFDPTDPDDLIGIYYLTGNQSVVCNVIGSYHDGGNGAEVYAVIGWAGHSEQVKATFFD